MELTAFEWWALVGVLGALFAGLIYFLKRTMNRVDKHDEDIHGLKLNTVSQEQLKEMKNELRSGQEKLTNDVAEIKDKVLYKEDFYRVTVDINNSIKNLQDLIIKRLGGNNSGDKG